MKRACGVGVLGSIFFTLALLTTGKVWAHDTYRKGLKLYAVTECPSEEEKNKPQTKRCFEYEVKKGDTLSWIATHFDSEVWRTFSGERRLTWQKLLKLRGNERFIRNPDLIHPGEKVVLPYISEEEVLRVELLEKIDEIRKLQSKVDYLKRQLEIYKLLTWVFAVSLGVIGIAVLCGFIYYRRCSKDEED